MGVHTSTATWVEQYPDHKKVNSWKKNKFWAFFKVTFIAQENKRIIQLCIHLIYLLPPWLYTQSELSHKWLSKCMCCAGGQRRFSRKKRMKNCYFPSSRGPQSHLNATRRRRQRFRVKIIKPFHQPGMSVPGQRWTGQETESAAADANHHFSWPVHTEHPNALAP